MPLHLMVIKICANAHLYKASYIQSVFSLLKWCFYRVLFSVGLRVVARFSVCTWSCVIVVVVSMNIHETTTKMEDTRGKMEDTGGENSGVIFKSKANASENR